MWLDGSSGYFFAHPLTDRAGELVVAPGLDTVFQVEAPRPVLERASGLHLKNRRVVEQASDSVEVHVKRVLSLKK